MALFTSFQIITMVAHRIWGLLPKQDTSKQRCIQVPKVIEGSRDDGSMKQGAWPWLPSQSYFICVCVEEVYAC